MTDLDSLPFAPADSAPNLGAAPRRKHRHVWWVEQQTGHTSCHLCNVVRDDAAYRRGRSARRLGGDQERRIERVYGPRKIGERGDPVDHIGRVWRWQSKATRALPPLWLGAITEPTHRGVPLGVAVAWNRMTGLYGTRRSVVIRSFVRNGGLAAGRTRDWLFVGAEDAIAEFGPVIPFYTGWWVIPGDWWLDHFGTDAEEGTNG